jgi:hypothetical protein
MVRRYYPTPAGMLSRQGKVKLHNPVTVKIETLGGLVV